MQNSHTISIVNIKNTFWDIFKLFSRLGIPRAMSFTFSLEMLIIIWLLNEVDSDETHLAATGLTVLLISATAILLFSPMFALNPLLNYKLGEINQASDEDTRVELRVQLSDLAKQASLCWVPVIPTAIGIMFFAKPLLINLFGQSEEVAATVAQFTRPYAPAFIFLAKRLVFEELLFAFDDQVYAMLAALFALLIGVSSRDFLAYFGLREGGDGATAIAIGCVIESALTAFLFGLRLKFSNKYKDFHFFSINSFLKRIHQQPWMNLLSISASIFATNFSELAFPFMITVFANWSRNLGAVFSYAIQMINIVAFLKFALCFTACKEISSATGANDMSKAKMLSTYGLLTTLFYTSLPALGLMIYQLLNPFALQSSIETILPIMFVGIMADVVRFFTLQSARGFNDNIKASLISSLLLLAGIFIGYFLNNIFKFDELLPLVFTGIYGISAVAMLTRVIYTNTAKQGESSLSQRLLSWINPEEEPLTNQYDTPHASSVSTVLP